jgi:hypothetical protein
MVRKWSTVPISLSYTTPPPEGGGIDLLCMVGAGWQAGGEGAAAAEGPARPRGGWEPGGEHLDQLDFQGPVEARIEF